MGAHPSNSLEVGDHLANSDKSDAESMLIFLRRLARTQSEEELVMTLSQGVRTFLRADGVTLALRDGEFCYYVEEDAISPLWKYKRIPMRKSLSGWCMTNNRTAVVPDVYQDDRVLTDAYRPTFVRSLAVVPVCMNEPIAALGAYWSRRRQLKPGELERLQTIADVAAPAILMLKQRGAPKHQRRSLWNVIDHMRGRRKMRTGSLEAYASIVGLVLVATLARLAIDLSGVHGLVKYSTYYPVVLFAMLVGDRWAGLLASVLGGLAAYWFFMPPYNRIAPLTVADAINLSLYFASCGFIILTIDWYKHAMQHLKVEDANLLTLVREQNHRVRNALAVVNSIVHLSLGDDPERERAISRRIRASVAEIDLQEDAKQPASLSELLVAELQHYELSQFVLEGEETKIPLKARTLVALSIHELATNALKYGALSVPDGRVILEWHMLEGRVTLNWREIGGPPVKPPRRRGYGSIVLRRLVEAAGGALTIDFQPAGVTAQIILPNEASNRSRAKARHGAAKSLKSAS